MEGLTDCSIFKKSVQPQQKQSWNDDQLDHFKKLETKQPWRF